MEKENNTDESDFSENEIPDLNSLKPFEFEPKRNMGEINSSSSDDEEEVAEYKVKQNDVLAVRKQLLADVLQNRCQASNFIKRRLHHTCFSETFSKW